MCVAMNTAPSAASARLAPRAIYVLVIALQPAIGGLLAGRLSLIWSTAGAALVLAGLIVVRRMCTPISAPPLLMITFCALGMLAGLAVDLQNLQPFGLEALCTSQTPKFEVVAISHIAALPAMHGFMLLGGLSTLLFSTATAGASGMPQCDNPVCVRFGFNIACNIGMLGGMIGIGCICQKIAGGFDAMCAAMAGGMAWGMVITIAIYRAAIIVLHSIRAAARRRLAARKLFLRGFDR